MLKGEADTETALLHWEGRVTEQGVTFWLKTRGVASFLMFKLNARFAYYFFIGEQSSSKIDGGRGEIMKVENFFPSGGSCSLLGM